MKATPAVVHKSKYADQAGWQNMFYALSASYALAIALLALVFDCQRYVALIWSGSFVFAMVVSLLLNQVASGDAEHGDYGDRDQHSFSREKFWKVCKQASWWIALIAVIAVIHCLSPNGNIREGTKWLGMFVAFLTFFFSLVATFFED